MTYQYNRLFVEGTLILPTNQVLEFNSLVDVENYFGMVGAIPALAKEYFAPGGPPAAMLFTRFGVGQRPHLIGANISDLTLAQLQAIQGSLSLTFDGFTYSGNVDLTGAASLGDAAIKIRDDIRYTGPAASHITASITPVTINFTGTVTGASVNPDGGTTLVVGGLVEGAGVTHDPAYNNQIIEAHTGGGFGVPPYWTTFANAGNTHGKDEALTETYGILHVSGISAGVITPGERLAFPGVPADTSIVSQIDENDWVVNNALTVAPEAMTTTAPSLTVQAYSITGATSNHDFLEIAPGGAYGFDENPSDLSFMTGTAADALGLSQASGAMDSSPGGQHPTTAQWMNQVVQEVHAMGTDFSTFQTNEARLVKSETLWAQKNPQYTFLPTYITSTPPAGYIPPNVAEAFALLHPLGTVETGGRGDVQGDGASWGITAAIGHGPGAGL